MTTKANATASPVAIASGGLYEPFGPLATLTYGNGLNLSVQFDQDYQPSTRTVTGTSNVQNLSYNFDAAGDITAITDNLATACSQALHYDALYRLTQASGAYGTYTYGYDAVGNITNDDFGNGTVFSFLYGQDNRLARATHGAAATGYARDHRGRVFLKAGTNGSYVHEDSAGHLIGESNTAGVFRREYVWLDDLPVAFYQAGNLSYIHTDHLGAPQKLTDGGQSIVWDAVSDPFMAQPLPTNLTVDLRLPGQQYDALTGLHDNGMRDYDPTLGRYIESDPIGLDGGINTYAYVRGNPVRFIDRTGTIACAQLAASNDNIPRNPQCVTAAYACLGAPFPVNSEACHTAELVCNAAAEAARFDAPNVTTLVTFPDGGRVIFQGGTGNSVYVPPPR